MKRSMKISNLRLNESTKSRHFKKAGVLFCSLSLIPCPSFIKRLGSCSAHYLLFPALPLNWVFTEGKHFFVESFSNLKKLLSFLGLQRNTFFSEVIRSTRPICFQVNFFWDNLAVNR